MEKKKKNVKSKKTVYTFNYLKNVAWNTLEEAEENEKGSYYNCMASIVFSAFTIEAYLNHIGEKLIPFWKTIERNLSPAQKLEILSEKLNMTIDFGKQPFQSFKEIFKFRNLLAHGKSATESDENIQFLEDDENPIIPEILWQKQVTSLNARKYFDNSIKIIEYIHKFTGFPDHELHSIEFSDWWIHEIKVNEGK